MAESDYDREEVVAKWIYESEEDQDDVEAIDIQLCRSQLLKILFHLALSFIFLGVCAGALIYSFVRGEAGSGVNNNSYEPRNASVNFTIFVNEFSASGVYRITLRQSLDSRENLPKKKHVQTTKSFWYQNNAEKKIAHKIDANRIVYVYDTYSYWVTLDKKERPQNCRRSQDVTYDSYVKRLGLAKMTNPHSEMEITHHKREVFIYDGDPESVLLEGTDERAFLVRAYADRNNGALLGWDTFFGAKNESKIYKTEYWYDNMEPRKPSQAIFDNMPGICGP